MWSAARRADFRAMKRSRTTRAALGACAAIATTTALAAPAQAGVLTTSATNCADPELSQPFAPWADHSYYKLVDNGAFETGTEGWTLTGGARVVNGNATQQVHGAADAKSLSLPAGSTATTPPVCVGLNEPTLRYFARKNSGLLSTLTVSVQVQLVLGGTWVTLPIGVDLGGSWHPSLPHLVVANLLPLLPPDMTAVRFKFAPLLGGDWQLDDVYVDPRQRT
jgi:hypothetical protein